MPKTDSCKIKQQIVTGKFNLRYQLQLMLQKQIVQKFAGGAVTFQGDQWVAGKLRQAQYPGFQWVISRICHEYIMEFTDSFPDVRLV